MSDRLAAARQFVEDTRLRADDAGYAGRLIKELLAEVERLRAVAEAAKRWREMPRRSPHPAEWLDAETALVAAVDALAGARPQDESP